MQIRGHTIGLLAVPIIAAALMLVGTGTAYAQAKGMGAPPSKVEITIKDRTHGYDTVGFTMPSQDTTIVVRNMDSVTHGFAAKLFKEVSVRMEGDGVLVEGRNIKAYHVDPGKTMVLHFSTMASKNDPATGIAESARYAIWCDIHPEVRGELYVVETKGEVGGG
ncbi:MAG: hypothetical protein P0111_00530 [Nitrospira sp.]|nr:hypothetical protein [Nitrospira sp.]